MNNLSQNEASELRKEEFIKLKEGYVFNHNRVLSSVELHDFYVQRGNSCYKNGNLHGAINDYEKAIEVHSGFATPYYNLGVIYHKAKFYKEAIEHFTLAIEKNIQYPESYFYRAFTKIKLNSGKKISITPDSLEDIRLGIHHSALYSGNLLEISDENFLLINDTVATSLKEFFKELFSEEE